MPQQKSKTLWPITLSLILIIISYAKHKMKKEIPKNPWHERIDAETHNALCLGYATISVISLSVAHVLIKILRKKTS